MRKYITLILMICFSLGVALAQMSNVVKPVVEKAIIKRTAKGALRQGVKHSLEKQLAEKGYKLGQNRMLDAYYSQYSKKIMRNKLAQIVEKEGAKSMRHLTIKNVRKSLPKAELNVASRMARSRQLRNSRISDVRRNSKIRSGLMSARRGYPKAVVAEIEKFPTLKKQTAIYEDMASNQSLRQKIESDPERYVAFWAKTHNKVDKRLIDGIFMKNGPIKKYATTYSGNIYSFDVDFNPYLKNRLLVGNGQVKLFGNEGKILSESDFKRLAIKYPEGFQVKKTGFPDFKSVALKDDYGRPVIIDVGELSTASNGSKIDISKAMQIYRNQYGVSFDEANYTFHHIENSTQLIAVPKEIHGLYIHAGGRATLENQMVMIE